MAHLIAPSILASDFTNLKADFEMLNKSQADWLHIDVMDGHFVPNISFGFPLLKAFKTLSRQKLDVHLMIAEPQLYVERFVEAGAEIVSVHWEALKNPLECIEKIKGAGAKASIAINPGTPVNHIEAIVKHIDMLLIMSVNPGFGGQKFIPETILKVSKARKLSDEYGARLKIQVDGGVSLENAPELLRAGADVLVAGSAVFKADDPEDYIARMKGLKPHTKVS